jgi:hypothetical protein
MHSLLELSQEAPAEGCVRQEFLMLRWVGPAIVLTVVLVLLADLGTAPTSPPIQSCTLGLKQSICRSTDTHT